MNVEAIQSQLKAEGVDGWLFFDHHVRDPLAYRVLGMKTPAHVSRRWYYWIPAEGEPRKLAHKIEPNRMDEIPGARLLYSGWREQREQLRALLDGAKRVAMQYSPDCMIPYVSLVDAGTVELVRGLGKEIVSSASLIQYFEARWTDAQLEMHREAGRRVDATLDEAFEVIGKRVKTGGVDEFTVAEFIRERFRERGLHAEDGPIVGAGPNSGNPHYGPPPQGSLVIREGDFVLIDLWAKLNEPDAVYYDITWTGYCGETPPERIQHVFEAVTAARDAALKLIDGAVGAGRPIAGYEADDEARRVLTEAGLGEAFRHRLGHSIGQEVHGNGANLDNLETHDDRPIIPRTCFSIEPGAYLPEFGVRSEIDCYVSETGAAATGRVQREIVRIG